jgi:hypothetical protein
MRIGVVGGRTVTDSKIMCAKLDYLVKEYDSLVSGGAAGADTIAELYAKKRMLQIEVFLPDPKLYPEENPYHARNRKIAERCELLVAFPTKDSVGTWDTVQMAMKLRKRVIIYDM